jgi:hypothetical protein
MARLRGIFHFRVRGLLVSNDLLGAEYRLIEDDLEVAIRLPSEAPASATTNHDDQPSAEEIERLFPGWLPAELVSARDATSLTLGFGPHDPGFSAVRLLRVEVDFDGDIQAADYVDRPHEGPFVEDPAEVMLQAARQRGEKIVNAFVVLIRTQVRQSWLGLEGELIEGAGAGILVDLDAFTSIPRSISIGPPGLVIQRIRADHVLDSAGAEELITKVRSGQAPDLAESLLLDALFVAHHSEPTASLSALLLEATAVEFRIKEVLRRAAHGSTLEMLELLMTNPRDWSLAAAALWDRPSKIILGSSLREADPELWKHLEKLIQRRNGLAHKGKIPSSDEITEDVTTAVRLFEWLDQGEGR